MSPSDLRKLADSLDNSVGHVCKAVHDSVAVLRACADLLESVPRSLDCCIFNHVGIANYHRDGEVCPPQRRFEAAIDRLSEIQP